jgi:L-lysine exporter family protein LysE/ArgO
MLVPSAQGFIVNWGLLLAISPQGLYVLAEGMRGRHAVCVSTTCLMVDFVLIGAGTLGIGTVLASAPMARDAALCASIAFLILYGMRAVWLAFREGAPRAFAVAGEATPRGAVIGALAVSLLDPCVYLDALIVLAGAAASFEPQDRLLFAAGALSASAMWFYGLGAGGRRLAPVLSSARARATLDVCCAAAVWVIAGMLITSLW